METVGNPAREWLTSTQIGAVGEALVTAGLILASRGRLAPFRPVADDNGHDLLVYDKQTRRCVPLQIKCRTALDRGPGKTVQFDVRINTFAREGDGMILFVMTENDRIGTCWLVPVAELEGVSRRSAGKLSVVASPNPESRDRYTSYRCRNIAEVTESLVRRLEGLMPA